MMTRVRADDQLRPERGVLRPRPHAHLRIVGVHPGDHGAQGRPPADAPVRPRRPRRARLQAARVERRLDGRCARPHPRRRRRDAPGRPRRPQRRGAAEAAGQDPPRGPSPARPPPPRRPEHVHRVGRAGRDRRVAGPLARHDRRHRHPRRGRRRHVHREARRAVRVRRREGGGDGGVRPVGRARPRPVLRLLGLGERPADAAGGRPPGRRQPRLATGPPRQGERLADRPLQPAHEVGDPSLGHRGGSDGDRRRQLRRRHKVGRESRASREGSEPRR